MFYSAGTQLFKLGNCYENPDSFKSIEDSVWGITRNSKTINLNRLGGRGSLPNGLDGFGYVFLDDNARAFYAQDEIISNLEQDLEVKREHWTITSRIAIEDQLFGLALVREDNDDVQIEVSCSRSWNDIRHMIIERCFLKDYTFTTSLNVNLFINVRVQNGNMQTRDNIIRICYPITFNSADQEFIELNEIINA